MKPRPSGLYVTRKTLRPAAVHARRFQSTESNAPPVASSSKLPFSSTLSSSASSTPISKSKTAPPDDGRPPILPFLPYPRPPNFRPLFKGEQPTHKLYNYPSPTFAPDPDNIEVAGNQSSDTKASEKILSLQSGVGWMERAKLRKVVINDTYVSHMTKKGRMRRVSVHMLVGDPDKGLVGLGKGSSQEGMLARNQAFAKAVMSMDFVERYENRTVWGQGKELNGKFGATQVHLRARPPGFGLFVPHSVHRVLTACGIKDASANIIGSTHPVNVAKCVIQMLHGGANPQGFGSGFGTRGKRVNKGAAMRTKEEIERARGRYGVDVGRRI